MPQYIYDINDLDLDKTYSYADYLLWRFKERVELFKGKIYKMSPAPSMSHQKVVFEIAKIIDKHKNDNGCSTFIAPFDVELFPQTKQATTLQPDVCVVCDASKLDERGCHGAPDLVVEVLSKGNSKKEIKDKFDLYEEAGVQEYWIVDYLRRTVSLHHLDSTGKYQAHRMLTEGDTVTSVLFPELSCAVNDIFKGVPDRLGEPEPEYQVKESN
ncbi:MAG: Uma2 family endonuclease [Nonlabens sp.]|uniref:Uma2 family endonuclease n=1 Tax=Nonlabens sp. TaxID=1888209 RepID=UPI003EFAA4E9